MVPTLFGEGRTMLETEPTGVTVRAFFLGAVMACFPFAESGV